MSLPEGGNGKPSTAEAGCLPMHLQIVWPANRRDASWLLCLPQRFENFPVQEGPTAGTTPRGPTQSSRDRQKTATAATVAAAVAEALKQTFRMLNKAQRMQGEFEI